MGRALDAPIFQLKRMEGLLMFSARMLGRVVIPVLVATSLQPLVAEETVGTTPPAKSIREWMSPTPSPAPAASPTASPGAPTLATAKPAGPTSPARSIREWMTPAQPMPGPCPVATPLAAATPAPKPTASASGPKTPITISLTSSLREGNLVVMLDGVPVFDEKFQKPMLLISQTTTWDPLQVPAGAHRLSAKVYGSKKTYSSKLYDLHVSPTKGSALRFVMQGDTLTVQLAS
jgi:hypothetical protein